jgi:hypothetical protein
MGSIEFFPSKSQRHLGQGSVEPPQLPLADRGLCSLQQKKAAVSENGKQRNWQLLSNRESRSRSFLKRAPVGFGSG